MAQRMHSTKAMTSSKRFRACFAAIALVVALVGCNDASGPRDAHVRVSRLSVSSEILPTAPPTGLRYGVRARATPQGSLLSWQDGAGAHWRRLTLEGEWLDGAELPFPAGLLDVAATDAGYMAVSADVASSTYATLKLLTLTASGALVGDPLVIDTLSTPLSFGDLFQDARIALNDGVAFVLGSEWVSGMFLTAGAGRLAGYRLHGIRIAGGVAESIGFPGSGDQHGSVVSGPSGFALFWSSTDWQHFLPPGASPPPPYANRWFPTQWTGTVIPTQGPSHAAPTTVLPPLPVPPDPWPMNTYQRYNDAQHVLASDGAIYLLVWTDGENIRGQARGSDLSEAGQPFTIATGGSIDSVVVTFAAGSFLIAWSKALTTGIGRDIYGVRVTATGQVLGQEPFPIVVGDGYTDPTSLVPSGGRCALMTYAAILSNSDGGSYVADNARLIHLDDASGCEGTPSIVQATTITYSGAVTEMFDRPATLVARLATDAGGVSNQTLTFSLGAQTCTGLTDAQGYASCVLVPGPPAGAQPLGVAFAGTTALRDSRLSTTFVVTREPTFVEMCRLPIVVSGGRPLSLAGRLMVANADAPALVGRPLTFSLRIGFQTTSCTATTDRRGGARCILTVPREAGPGEIGLFFDGDTSFEPSAAASPVRAVWHLGHREEE